MAYATKITSKCLSVWRKVAAEEGREAAPGLTQPEPTSNDIRRLNVLAVEGGRGGSAK